MNIEKAIGVARAKVGASGKPYVICGYAGDEGVPNLDDDNFVVLPADLPLGDGQYRVLIVSWAS